MRRADYWVAADADSCRLAKSERRKLADGLVCQRAGPRNDPDPALFMNVSGHDADLALAGRDDAGAVWPDHSRFARAQIFVCLDHIHDRNALGNAYDERQACIGGLHYRVGCEWRRHIDHRGVRARLFYRIGNRIENRNAFVRGAALSGRNTADHIRAVITHLQRVKRAFFARNSLDDQTCTFID